MVDVVHHVINLSESTDRWNTMKRLPIKMERFEAIDGKRVDLSVVELGMATRANLMNKNKHSHLDIDSVGALGAYLSHFEVWKKIADTQASVVLEDDVILHADYATRLKQAQASNYDIVMLGIQHGPNRAFSSIKPWTRGGNLVNGVFAYYLTPQGARTLIKNAFPVSLSVDHYVYGQCGLNNVPIGYVNAVSHNSFTRHTIFHAPLKRDYPYQIVLISILILSILLLHQQTQHLCLL